MLNACVEPIDAELARLRTGPAHAAVMTRAEVLCPLIDKYRAQGDCDRRIPAPLMEAMKDSGVFRLLQPQRYGGEECHPFSYFSLQAALSAFDMSSGWVQGVMGLVAFHLALFPPEAQDDVWRADPDALLASSYMPAGKAERVPGGFRLRGRWGYSSGADYADWLMLGAMVVLEGATPEHVVFLVPRADLQIHDTWHTIGLRATGSQDVTVDDCFIPEYRIHSIQDRFAGMSAGLKVNTAALYRIPLPQMLFRAISTPALGGLRGSLDAFLAHSRDRTAQMKKPPTDPVAQLACAEATDAIDEMTCMMQVDLERLLAHARSGHEGSIRERMIIRLRTTSVTERCCALSQRLFKASGASGLSVEKPLGRILADLQAARQHAANQYESHGRALGALLQGVELEDTLL